MTTMHDNNWPIVPTEWQSTRPNDAPLDYLLSKKRQGLQTDNHCKLTFELVKPYIKNARCAVDIGSRDGEFSHYLQAFGFEHIYCFESRWDYNWLKNYSANLYNKNITLFWNGLSNQKETILSSGVGILNHFDPNRPQKQITLYTLDAFNLTSVDLIKIDTDGYEMKVIEGAQNTIINNSPILIIEQDCYDKKEALAYCIEKFVYRHVATCSRKLDHILIKG